MKKLMKLLFAITIVGVMTISLTENLHSRLAMCKYPDVCPQIGGVCVSNSNPCWINYCNQEYREVTCAVFYMYGCADCPSK